MSGAGDPKRKRVAVIIVSSFLLVGMVVAVTVGIALTQNHDAKGSGKDISTSNKAIKSMCQQTEYQEECVQSLEEEAGNSTNPKELVQAAFRSAKKKLHEAAAKSDTIQALAKDPLTKEALATCTELANHSIADLERSVQRVVDMEITRIDQALLDLKTWLSAAYTYQDTCLDSFQDPTGEASGKMREALKSSMQMTTNGLTMVSELHKALDGYNISSIAGRLLLLDEDEGEEEGLPSWMDKRARRLLGENGAHADMVVAQDGSGQFKSINEAIKAIPSKRPPGKPFIVHIKAGVYKEQVTIQSSLKNLVFIGDGPTKSRITWDSNRKITTTYLTATLGT